MANYIRKIEIQGLWGICDIVWDMPLNVNVLAGANGTGKSTVLRSVGNLLTEGALSERYRKLVESVTITFDDGTKVDSLHKIDAAKYNVQVISTFDTQAVESEALTRISGGEITTDLDLALYLLHQKYLSYQLEISHEMINALTEGKPTCDIIAQKEMFFDIIDSLFETSKKKIERNRPDNKIAFTKGNTRIYPYQLSSGEKQMLIILLSVLVCNRRPIILLMDEPDISLHMDWQHRLLDDILRINPNTQIIMSTHSPGVVMKGWTDRVCEMTDIVVNTRA